MDIVFTFSEEKYFCILLSKNTVDNHEISISKGKISIIVNKGKTCINFQYIEEKIQIHS